MTSLHKYYLSFLVLLVSTIIQAQSSVDTVSFYSPALEVEKNYLIYLPDGYHANIDKQYPSVYFLRLHECEWFDPDFRTHNKTLHDVLDELIENGQIGKMIIVAPSTGSDIFVEAVGIVNMLRPDFTNAKGIGTGAFEDYFFQDLIPHIDSTYRTIPKWCARGVDGFSLGGYSSTLYGLKQPGVFSSIGSYDGTLMTPDVEDPANPWAYPQFLDFWYPMFDRPFNYSYMELNSPYHVLQNADPATLDSIRNISFHISSIRSGNWSVNESFVELLASKSIVNTFDPLAFDPLGVHHQDWADRYAAQSLVKHWNTFNALSCEGLITAIDNEVETPQIRGIQSFPNPVHSTLTVDFEIVTSQHIQMDILNASALKLRNIISSNFIPGKHQIQVDMSAFPNGVYYYQLESEHQTYVKKIVILK